LARNAIWPSRSLLANLCPSHRAAKRYLR
jgi:hypothetical protein